jgi:hypothetical protein
VVRLKQCCAVAANGQVDEPAASWVAVNKAGEVVCHAPVHSPLQVQETSFRAVSPCCQSICKYTIESKRRMHAAKCMGWKAVQMLYTLQGVCVAWGVSAQQRQQLGGGAVVGYGLGGV